MGVRESSGNRRLAHAHDAGSTAIDSLDSIVGVVNEPGFLGFFFGWKNFIHIPKNKKGQRKQYKKKENYVQQTTVEVESASWACASRRVTGRLARAQDVGSG